MIDLGMMGSPRTQSVIAVEFDREGNLSRNAIRFTSVEAWRSLDTHRQRFRLLAKSPAKAGCLA